MLRPEFIAQIEAPQLEGHEIHERRRLDRTQVTDARIAVMQNRRRDRTRCHDAHEHVRQIADGIPFALHHRLGPRVDIDAQIWWRDGKGCSRDIADSRRGRLVSSYHCVAVALRRCLFEKSIPIDFFLDQRDKLLSPPNMLAKEIGYLLEFSLSAHDRVSQI